MEYRFNKKDLLDALSLWNGFLKKKVHLIACGGTALTLLGIKESTKDVDFIVPVEAEHSYLLKVLRQLGYKQTTGSGWNRKGDSYIFDLFGGKRIHTTDLLESPLKKNNHIFIKELTHIYIGVLNYYDLIISKLFRGSGVDFEDCLALMRTRKEEIKIDVLNARFMETAKYDVSENKIIKNLEHLHRILSKEKLHGK